MRSARPKGYEAEARRIPAGRTGQPHELAWAATFLCSPYATYITGHTLVIDGGQLAAARAAHGRVPDCARADRRGACRERAGGRLSPESSPTASPSPAAVGGKVLRELRDGVGLITFNRPECHNAIDDELRGEWREALVWAAEKPDVRVVLLQGAGPSFCSGRDTRALGQRPAGVSHRDYVQVAQAMRLQQVQLAKPVIAAVQGHAVGAGAELTLGADWRIAAEDMSFRLPEVIFGLVADTGATVLLTALIGPARAKWLLMSGEAIDAPTALAWGLVEQVVPRERLADVAWRQAQKLAQRPQAAMAQAKHLVDAQWLPALQQGLARELEAQLALFDGDEYQGLLATRRRQTRETSS